MTLSFEHQLRNYANLAVNIGVRLQAGQQLIVRAPVDSAPLVRLITEYAYQAGARLVDVMWADDALTLARFTHAPRDSFDAYPTWQTEALEQAAERGDAILSVHATDPDLLKDQDPELVALTQRVHQINMRPFYKKIMNDAINWSIIAYPLASWAARIFPDDAPEHQVSKLWQAIFTICRADQPDPVEAWQRHTMQLAQKRDYLSAKQYTALKLTGPDTDLVLGLPKHHEWHGGEKETLSGIPFIPNIPTEEVFTMPHKDRVDGVLSSTKPLSYGGVLIEDFSLTFAEGNITGVTAGKGEAVLRGLIETDDGSSRLGEIALVPQSSPISQTGLLFYNTLFDENASSHVAIGRAYRFCVKNGPEMSDEAFAAAGGNDSLTHVDFMIGSAEMDIDGITTDGQSEPVMRAGEWAAD